MKKQLILAWLLNCIFTATIFGQDVLLKIPIWFTDADTIKWMPDSLYFGLDPRATDCVDGSLGEFFAHDECGLFFLHCAGFVSPFPESKCGDRGFPIWKDFRHYYNSAQIDTYSVRYVGTKPIIMHWPSYIKDIYDSARIFVELYGITLINANMFNQDSLKIDLNLNRVLFKMCGPKAITHVPIKNDFIPNRVQLSPCYPNPFNPSTIIRYDIPENSHVKLSVYDIMGREVTILVNEYKKVGRYEVVWDATDYPSGVYFYRLRANNFIDTKRILFLK